jgi:gliding motility-associated-like protein
LNAKEIALKKQLFFGFLFILINTGALAQTQALSVNAGTDQKVCPGLGITIGGNPTAVGGHPPYTYQWYPTTGLTNASGANPTAYITMTTTYVVTVTDATMEYKKDTIVLSLYNYSVSAGNDTTIQQGETIQLHGSAPGATGTFWTPDGGPIYNQNTLTPDVFPYSTQSYTLTVTFPGGCILYDQVTVNVIKGKNLYFYNTFTPNGDGSNDAFYIGNIQSYPDNVLEIYNRYGQKVYTKTGYANDWDGKYLGNELPAGTYFYILDTKDPVSGKHKGSVTILR